MQEAALAPGSICYVGDGQMPLLDLLRAFRFKEYKYYSADNPVDSTSLNTALRNILTLWRYVDPAHGPYRKAQGATIADALVFARGLNSSQPRDHVFGLLGLNRYRSLSVTIMEKLRPAYSRSVLDIFRDATVAALMEADGIPDLVFEELIYHHNGLRPISGDGWPSWVPKWADARALDKHPGRINKWYFSASGQEPFQFTQVDDETIQVGGRLIDRVIDATEICDVMRWRREGVLHHLASWLQDVDSTAEMHRQECLNAPRCAIDTTLLAGLNGEGRPAGDRDIDAFEAARQSLISGSPEESPGSSRISAQVLALLASAQISCGPRT